MVLVREQRPQILFAVPNGFPSYKVSIFIVHIFIKIGRQKDEGINQLSRKKSSDVNVWSLK